MPRYKTIVSTFGLIGNARKRILKKLSTIAVQVHFSREYKNIICDRADQVEPTLAHMVSEFTTNIIGAIAMFIYMMSVDRRVVLLQLTCIRAGFAAFAISH